LKVYIYNSYCNDNVIGIGKLVFINLATYDNMSK